MPAEASDVVKCLKGMQSNAFVKSIVAKTEFNFWCLVVNKIFDKRKSAVLQDLLRRKPCCWYDSKLLYSRYSVSYWLTIFSNNLPKKLRREIGWKLVTSHILGYPSSVQARQLQTSRCLKIYHLWEMQWRSVLDMEI